MALLPQSQGLHLQKLKQNPGMLPVKEGQAYRQEDKWIIVKRFDLNELGNELTLNTNKYMEFIKLVNSNKTFINEFVNIKNQAEHLNNATISKFWQLVPSRRMKRGLINPLGSLIKIISGNLDNDDAIRYDKDISMLSNKDIVLQRKMTLVTKVLDNFVNSTGTLNDNILIIDKRLKAIENIINETSTKENTYLYLTHVLNMFNTFMNTFRTIYDILNEIETALAFTKVSVLHQTIVNSTELLYLLKSIEQTHNLLYDVNESNLLKFERIIKVKAYVKESQITFILEVPLTDKIIFDYYKLYSLPFYNGSINKTIVVFPDFPYLLAKSSKYLPVTKPCERIDNEKFLCAEDNVVQFQTLTCAEQLLEYQNPTKCVQYIVEVEDVKVQRIGLDSWIIFTRKPTEMAEKCENENTKETLQGTYIITTKFTVCYRDNFSDISFLLYNPMNFII